MMEVISQNFITGFILDENNNPIFTLTSLGVNGKPNVEIFDNVFALDHKIETLEQNGFEVVCSPIIKPELYSRIY